METMKQTIERMPLRTWRWLKVNDTDIELAAPQRPFDRVVSAMRPSDAVTVSREPVLLAEGDDGTGRLAPAVLRSFLETEANWRCHLRVADGHTEAEPIVLEFRLDDDHPTLADDLVVEVGEGARATVVVRYLSSAHGMHQHAGRIRLIARRGASLTLVKAQLFGNDTVHTDVIGAVAGEGASIHIIDAELGGRNAVTGCNAVLDGADSRVRVDLLYLGSGSRTLDLTTRAEHRGQRSESAIDVRGVLLDDSRKVLRDTLDFVRGAAGSRGREEENVLMLSPRVRNLSVPVLLCGEDDVEGEHAASSGRPDEAALFYLMSRGLSETHARKLLAQAAFAAVVERIPDLATQELILDAVQAAVGGVNE